MRLGMGLWELVRCLFPNTSVVIACGIAAGEGWSLDVGK